VIDRIKKKRLLTALCIILVAVLLRVFVLQSYRSASDAMDGTLAAGDYFLVNKLVFGRHVPLTDRRFLSFRAPRRGDIVVFQYPEDPGKDFAMRVVGVPGDEVEGRDKEVYVNGRPCNDLCVAHREQDVVPREQNPRDNFGPVKVPDHALFVMGDNRDRSYDSRFWGCVGYGRIKGLAFFRYWSWDREKRRVRWDRIGRIE
jgi:signal peptidase I